MSLAKWNFDLLLGLNEMKGQFNHSNEFIYVTLYNALAYLNCRNNVL